MAQTDTPAGLAIEWWPLDRVIPYARNPRRRGDAAVAKVAGSIREFGWRQPLVVDRAGVLVVGHTRLDAARQLGLDRVPVHVAGDLTPAQAKAYRLADNRTGDETEWDTELLGLELGELDALDDLDLALTGFDEDEIGALMADPNASIKSGSGAEELSPNDFAHFDHFCPRCGFGFNDTSDDTSDD